MKSYSRFFRVDFTFVFLLLTIVLSISTQESILAKTIPTYSIYGRLAGPSGLPLKGVMVYINGSGRNSYAATDTNGNYSFFSLPSGGYYTITLQKTDGIVFTPSTSNISGLSSNKTVNFRGKASTTLQSKALSGKNMWFSAIKTGATVASAKGILRIPGPSGVVGLWLAVLSGDPNLAMPPGVQIHFHCSPGKGMALFVSGKNVFGDRSLTWAEANTCDPVTSM